MKKILLLLTTLLIMVIIITFTITSGHAISVTIYGDADTSGKVTIDDATAVQMHLAQIKFLSTQGEENGKVQNGERLSIADATLIQQYLARLIDKFPVEDIKPTETKVTETTSSETQATSQTETETQSETIKMPDTNIKIYFSDNIKWTNVNAYIFNDKTDAVLSPWPGSSMKYEKVNEYGEKIYSINVDTKKYNHIIFNNGKDQTTDIPVTPLNSAFFIQQDGSKFSMNDGKYIAGVYPYEETSEGKTETTTLSYPKSLTHAAYSKKITIWLPKNYSKSKKYSTLYMCDGQNILGTDPKCSPFEWEADETILSLQKNNGDGIIVVGIDNTINRDSELTPPITDTPTDPTAGGKKFTTPTGDVFSDFVVNTVIPYIDKTYSTNSIRGIVGSSSGGIEAFYIGIEHPDKFRYIGALSPAFLLFKESEWNSYLSKFNFTKKAQPNVHLYFGNSKADQLEIAIYNGGNKMENWLKKYSYPGEKILTSVDNNAIHNEIFWALHLQESISFGLDFTK